MSASTIKEFLVGLGFKVDESSQRKFVDGVTNAESGVKKLVAAIEVLGVGAAAYAAVRWLDNMTSGMEKLYYASQRAGEKGAGALQSFGYAASQMGSSVEQAFATAQSFHQWMLNNPNTEKLLQNNLGISSRDEHGNLLGGAEVLQKVGAKFSTLDPRLQKMYSDLMGIPLELRNALMQSGKFQGFEDENTRRNRQLGVNPDKAAEDAHNLQVQVRRFGGAFDRASEAFTTLLTKHMPQIEKVMTAFFNTVMPAIGRVIDWLAGLSGDQVKAGLIALGAFLALLAGGALVAGITAITGAAVGAAPALIAMAAAAAAFAAFWYAWKHPSPHPEDGTWGKIYQNFGSVGAAIMSAVSPDAADAWMRQHGRLPKNHSGDMTSHPTHSEHGGSTRGIRNNNPGNIKYGKFAQSLGATGEDANGFAIFPTAAAGLNAIAANLASYARKGFNTPSSIAHRWSKTDQGAYTKHLAAMFGGDENKVLNMADPAVINALRNGIIQQENGRNPYQAEMGRKIAGPAGKPAAGTTLNANTTINVNGTTDPQTTAEKVANKQASVNQRMQRNFRQVVA